MSEEELYQLLDEYFNNTIDPVDCASLFKYLDNADNESTQTVIDDVLKKYEEGPLFDQSQSKMVFNRILSDSRYSKVPLPKPGTKYLYPKNRSIVWLGYAATAFIILSFGLYLFRDTDTVKTKALPVPEKIASTSTDSTKARLTIAGKETLLLDETKGSLLTISGNIAISKTKDGKVIYNSLGKTATNESSSVYNTLSVPRGGEYQIVLPDGTKVWLNSASSLSFPAVFKGNERKVILTGEAYFEVAKNKKMPFNVNANGTAVQVLGTHFNISAYKDDENVRTTLLEGSVRVANNGKQVILKPNQQAVSAAGDENMLVKGANTEEVMAWKNGYFVFEESDIKTIMKDLVRWYNIEIVYSGKITTQKFGGTFSRSKDITELLKYLESLGGVHFRKEGRSVTVMP